MYFTTGVTLLITWKNIYFLIDVKLSDTRLAQMILMQLAIIFAICFKFTFMAINCNERQHLGKTVKEKHMTL